MRASVVVGGTPRRGLMLTATLLGIPLTAWGCFCLLVAVTYLIYSPRPGSAARQRSYSTWRRLVLRWFHPVVWLLLALSCFIWGEYIAWGGALADALAIVSLMVYVIFIITFMSGRRSHRRD